MLLWLVLSSSRPSWSLQFSPPMWLLPGELTYLLPVTLPKQHFVIFLFHNLFILGLINTHFHSLFAGHQSQDLHRHCLEEIQMDSSSSRMYFSSSSSEQGGSSSSSNKESLAVSHLVQGSFGYFTMSPLPLACCSFETNLWKQSHDGWFYSNQVVQNLPSPASASLKPFTKTIPNFTKVNFQPVRGHQGGREKILPNPCTFQAAQCQARRTR